MNNSPEILKIKDKFQRLLDKVEKAQKRLNKLGKLLYLVWESIKRANYQPEHVKLTNYKEEGKKKLLETIQEEVELIENDYKKEILTGLSKEEILEQLSLRIDQGEIDLPELTAILNKYNFK